MQLLDIHRLRGLAIILVVAVHAVDQMEWPESPTLHRFLADLLQGATVLFFMISGYLFQHLARRFAYGDYLRRKLQHVIVPFIVISLPGIALTLARPAQLAQAHPEVADLPAWKQAVFLLFHAGSQPNYPLWFVPVMGTLFLLAPVFIALLRRLALFHGVLAGALTFSLLAHRADVGKYHHVELVAYYVGPYLLGMWACLYRKAVNAWVDRHLAHLGLAFFALLLGFFAFTPHLGTYVEHAFSRDKGLIDWVLLQKLVLFFLLLGLIRRYARRDLPWLDYLADVSFPVFFLHIYVLLALYHALHWPVVPGSVAMLLLLTATGVVGSIGIVCLCRALLPRHSRMIVGG